MLTSGVTSEQRGADSYYGFGFVIVAVVTFIGTWIYCIAEYGFLLGVGLGWLPALVIAFIVGALWPLLAAALGVSVIYVVQAMLR